MAKRRSQADHDRMVKYTADYLAQNGFRDVRADVPPYPAPTKITWKSTGAGHVPEVTAQGDKHNLFELETADSISDQHTRDQWTLCATYAMEHGAEIWVVVPQGSRVAANDRLNRLNIQAKVWEV